MGVASFDPFKESLHVDHHIIYMYRRINDDWFMSIYMARINDHQLLLNVVRTVPYTYV